MPAGNNLFTEDSTNWVLNHTVTLPHNFVNNFRFGRLVAIANQYANAAPASAVQALGLQGVFTNLPDYARGWPGVSFQNLSGGFGSPGNNPTTSNIPLWEYADSVTVVRGRHTFGFGFDYRQWIQKRDLSTNFLGSYSYNNNLVLTNGGAGTNNCRRSPAEPEMRWQTSCWATMPAPAPSNQGRSAPVEASREFKPISL